MGIAGQETNDLAPQGPGEPVVGGADTVDMLELDVRCGDAVVGTGGLHMTAFEMVDDILWNVVNYRGCGDGGDEGGVVNVGGDCGEGGGIVRFKDDVLLRKVPLVPSIRGLSVKGRRVGDLPIPGVGKKKGVVIGGRRGRGKRPDTQRTQKVPVPARKGDGEAAEDRDFSRGVKSDSKIGERGGQKLKKLATSSENSNLRQASIWDFLATDTKCKKTFEGGRFSDSES